MVFIPPNYSLPPFPITTPNTSEPEAATYTIDASKTPHQIDITSQKDGKEENVYGIYKVDGDTWKHSFSLAERPTEFKSKEGSGVHYVVFKRVKK